VAVPPPAAPLKLDFLARPNPEPAHGVRVLRVRGRLADGREFLSTATYIVPVDPEAAPAGKAS
jgi:hypothetical protein